MDGAFYVILEGGEVYRASGTAGEGGEAIAFSADGVSYCTVSEGRNPTLHFVGVAGAIPVSGSGPRTRPAGPTEIWIGALD